MNEGNTKDLRRSNKAFKYELQARTSGDNLSRKVVVKTITGKGSISVGLKGFNPGIYYYKITGAKYCEAGKLIVF